jgi:tetratricopeptide (TPR) repeat protein
VSQPDEDPDGPLAGEEDEGPGDEPEPGYLWTFERQERDLPEEYAEHMEILDELEAAEILDLDLSGRSDYILWAAAQSLGEQGRGEEAADLLRRLAASAAPHPALSYPEIRLRLHDLLRERGDYEEALAVLDALERDDPDRREACRERRAEVLVLSGRREEGLRHFEKAAGAIPDDPWIPLTAAWALIRAGDYEAALPWIGRGERAARRLEDEQEVRSAMAEVDRLRSEARARRERRARAAEPREAAGTGWAAVREAILADLDAEEVRLTRDPPRSEESRQEALGRLHELHRRASAAWDDAVERHDEQAIAALEDLQWEVVEVAERFGIRIPGTEE